VMCRKRVRRVEKTGWFDGVFVMPERTIGQSQNNERVVFGGPSGKANYAEAGTLEEWKKEVAARASGNSRLIFAISVAFAGPVADLLQEEPGGFHFVGPSSIGKSTALYLAVARRPLDGRTPRRPPANCYVRSTSTAAVRCAQRATAGISKCRCASPRRECASSKSRSVAAIAGAAFRKSQAISPPSFPPRPFS
jgi:hypothetical protein